MAHVSYRGAGVALNDLIPGRINALFAGLPGLLPHVSSGTVRALAITSAERSPFAMEIPTVSESGFPGFESIAWYALFAPRGTPEAIVQKIRTDVIAALAHPSVLDKFKKIAARTMTSTPAELATFMMAERDKWGPVIKMAGIKAQQ